MDWEHIVTAIIAAVLSGGAAWWISLRKLRPEIRQLNGTTGEIQGRAWLALTTALQANLAAALAQSRELEAAIIALRKEQNVSDDLILELRSKNARLQARIEVLLEQVVALGGAVK